MTSTAADEAPAALDAAIRSEATAGAALRRAREARGLHIAALAATLKVPQSKLEALEADRYHELPDATFARGLARSMCRALKIEAEPVLAMLPSSGAEAALDRVTPGLNQPFRERAASQEPVLSTAVLKSPVLLGGAALLVAALAVYLVPASVVDDLTRRVRGTDTSGQTAAGTGPAAANEPQQFEAPTVAASAALPTPADTVAAQASSPAAAGVQGGAGTPAPLPATTASAPATAPATAPANAPANAPAAAPIAAAPATATTTPAAGTSVAASAPAAAPAGASLLRVRATAETWVEVVDQQGQVLLSRLLRNGEQVDLNGVAPLRLRVGNVSGTELVFRGKPVDLAARARDNVARLELN